MGTRPSWLARVSRDRRRVAVIGTPLLVGALALGVWARFSGTPVPWPTPSPSATPSASPTPSPSPRPTASPTPTPSPTPSPVPVLTTASDGRFTVLVLGSDSSAARRVRGKAGLTDAITVVSVADDGSDIALVSLPRDTSDLPMPDGSTWTRKLNAITAILGPEAMRQAMALLLDVPIDGYVLVDMDDFTRLVNAVGGVTVTIPSTLSDTRCTISAGTQHLNGDLALCFARNRASDSDYARAGRHQQLLLAIRDRILSGGVNVASLIGSLPSLTTDLPLANLPSYLALLHESRSASVQRLVLAPPTYTTFVGSTVDRGWISIPNVPAIRQAVADMLGLLNPGS